MKPVFEHDGGYMPDFLDHDDYVIVWREDGVQEGPKRARHFTWVDNNRIFAGERSFIRKFRVEARVI